MMMIQKIYVAEETSSYLPQLGDVVSVALCPKLYKFHARSSPRCSNGCSDGGPRSCERGAKKAAFRNCSTRLLRFRPYLHQCLFKIYSLLQGLTHTYTHRSKQVQQLSKHQPMTNAAKKPAITGFTGCMKPQLRLDWFYDHF